MSIDVTPESSTGSSEVSAADSFYADVVESPETTDVTPESSPAKTPESESADEADETETESDPETNEEPTSSELKPKTAKRIQTLLKRQKELESQLAQARQASVQQPNPQQPPVEPDPDTFEGTWDELKTAQKKYRDELIKFEVAKDRQERADAARNDAIREYNQNVEAIWNKRTAKTIERNADFKDLVYANPQTGQIKPELLQGFSPVVHEFLIDSEVGPDVLLHLAKHPEERQALLRMTGIRQSRELVRLESDVQSKIKVPPTITRAPRPPATVHGSQSATVKEQSAEELFYK